MVDSVENKPPGAFPVPFQMNRRPRWRTLSREELYGMVWSRPIIHLARDFGMSDVGLRKICVKHGIPSPPLGYWAKLAHGKKVKQQALPPAKEGVADRIHLTVRSAGELSPAVSEIHRAAAQLESSPGKEILVPKCRPEKLHPVAAAAEKRLQKGRPNNEGFVSCEGNSLPTVTVGPASVDRAVRILDAFLKAVVARGHRVASNSGNFRIIVDNETFAFRVYGGKARKAHEPTAAELKAQVEQDRRRERYPDLYSSSSKVYRSWDHFPSGRLSMEIIDPARRRWNGEHVVGRWHDRTRKKLEHYLNDAMVSLATGAAFVQHLRAEEVEAARLRAEEEERRRREAARCERVRKRREFIYAKAEDYARLRRLETFVSFMEAEYASFNRDPVGCIAREATTLVAELRQRFERNSLNEEISYIGLFDCGDNFQASERFALRLEAGINHDECQIVPRGAAKERKRL